ncbi:MAG: metal ABC transporter solute-binding protein, Zn/Mn family [Thermoguttaceae bacterium]
MLQKGWFGRSGPPAAVRGLGAAPAGDRGTLSAPGLACWHILLIALSAPGLSGCGSGWTRPESRLLVVCTTGQVGDLLANLGGEHVAVETLMGPGVDPHLFKPTPRSLRLLLAADVVFSSGLHLEGRLSSLLEKLAQRKPVFAVTDGLRLRQPHLLRRLSGLETYDPHVWLDVSLWARCAAYAAEKLSEVDPAQSVWYRRRAEQYIGQLLALHRTCQQQLAAVPRQRRVLVTGHDAFGYFAQAYDVEVHALQGMSTADEADLAAVSDLVALLVRRRIKAVFVETSAPPRSVQALVESCAAHGHRIVVGGELFSDALGPAGTPEATYIGAVKHNLRTILEALQ